MHPFGEHTLTASHDVADSDGTNNTKSMTVKVDAQSSTPVANVSVVVSSSPVSKKGWKATAKVTVTDASGRLTNATVEGQWSGIYTATVTGSTNRSGVVKFVTGQLTELGTVTFTVTRIVGPDGRTYELDPPAPSDSYP